MIKSELLKDKGVLIVSPVGPLAASDFEQLAQEVDPYIEQIGTLHGLMVHAEFFPGWADFAAFLSHLKFAKDHQSKIEKVAAVSDSGFLSGLRAECLQVVRRVYWARAGMMACSVRRRPAAMAARPARVR